MSYNGRDVVKWLDYLLKIKNLKRKAVCDYAGISVQTITDWSKRGSMPAADTLYKIAQYLETTVEYLLTGKIENGIDPQTLKMAQDISTLSPEDREEIKLLINHKLFKYGHERRADTSKTNA